MATQTQTRQPTTPTQIPIPTHLPHPLPASLLSTLQSALLSSPRDPIPTLQSSLTSDLSSSGWTHALENFVREAMEVAESESESEAGVGAGGSVKQTNEQQRASRVREGVLARVLEEVGLRRDVEGGFEEDGEGDEGGNEGTRKPGRLKVPDDVVEAAYRLLRAELERLCVVVDGKGQRLS